MAAGRIASCDATMHLGERSFVADLPTRKDNVTAVPTSDPHELSDEELAKVAGGGGVIEDRTARKVTANVQVDLAARR